MIILEYVLLFLHKNIRVLVFIRSTCPFLIFTQSEYLIQVVHTNLNT